MFKNQWILNSRVVKKIKARKEVPRGIKKNEKKLSKNQEKNKIKTIYKKLIKKDKKSTFCFNKTDLKFV